MRCLSLVKYPIIVIIIATLLYQSADGNQEWISLNGSAYAEKVSFKTLRANSGGTEISFDISGFLQNIIDENGSKYHKLSLPDYFTTSEVGLPQLPVITELIAIPGDVDVTCTIIDSSVIVLKNYLVYPYQTELPEGEIREIFDIDSTFYSDNIFYPETITELSKPAIWRDIRVVRLQLCPFRYNPSTGELKCYKNLKIQLDYSSGSQINIKTYDNVRISRGYNNVYRNNILNYDNLGLPVGVKDRQDYQLLIITMTQFYQTMLTFHNFKESWCGIETHLQDYFDLGVSNPEGLKDYIQGEYDDHNIEFVILVGDISDMPTYDGYTYDDGEDMISDYYYTLLNGTDLHPEISIGRFSCEYDIEAYNMESKIRHFLQKDPNDNEWLNKALLVAHREEPETKYQKCKEDIRTAVYAHPPVFDVVYGAGTGTNNDVTNAIREGRGIVNYRGHGAYTNWNSWNNLSESFMKSDAAALANDTLTPIVLGIACWNNRLDASEWCLGEQFTLNEDGAVGYLSASRISWTYANNTYDRTIFKELFNNEGSYLGYAINAAATRIINLHNDKGKENAKMYFLLGDPSMTYPPVVTDDTTYVGVVIDTTDAMAGHIVDASNFLQDIILDIANFLIDLIALLPSPQDPGNPWPQIPPTTNPNDIISALEDMKDDVYIDTSYINDALCQATDFIAEQADTSTKRIIYATAGGRYDSGNECSGTNDTIPPWDDDPASWQYKVWNKIMTNNVILDVAWFGDYDIGRNEQPNFLRDLALASGGGWYCPADSAICGNGIVETDEGCESNDDCISTDGGRAGSYCENCECFSCDCSPGDVDNNSLINIFDITYMITYIYKFGPSPQPYPVCSGDPNLDCSVNIFDITYLISYLYKGGEVPGSCVNWIEGCGLPLH